MEINVHDIVQFATINDIQNHMNPPIWIKNAPAAQNFAVVRRMPIMNKTIPIGLRGETREERYGAFIHESNIIQVISPTSLVNRIDKQNDQSYFSTLNTIREEFEKYKLIWGPTGSIGFEIATSIGVTTPNSDIDICLYLDQINSELLVKVGNFLEGLNRRIDVQVEIPFVGAFLLNDYLKYEKTGFIVRTKFGPQLCGIVNGQIRLGVNS